AFCLAGDLTNPQRKALINAALIHAHDPSGKVMRNVKFIDDNDDNLKASMELLPKLFPHINFEFIDVVHKKDGHFEHRTVAKTGHNAGGALVGPNGALFKAEDIAKYSSDDSRFEGTTRR